MEKYREGRGDKFTTFKWFRKRIKMMAEWEKEKANVVKCWQLEKMGEVNWEFSVLFLQLFCKYIFTSK